MNSTKLFNNNNNRLVGILRIITMVANINILTLVKLFFSKYNINIAS